MKKIVFVLLFLGLFYNNSNAQKIDEKKIDPFTKELIVNTKYETLFKTGSFMLSSQSTASYSFLKLNDEYYIQLKITVLQGKVFSVPQGSLFYLKLSGGDVIELKSEKSVISSAGGGATGFVGSAMEGAEVTYKLNDSDIDKLVKSDIVSARVQTSEGYIEDLEIKNKISKVFKKSLELVINTK